MEKAAHLLNQDLTLILILLLSLVFTSIGILYSRKHKGISNYLTANRNIETLSLTTSMIASALGAWILFGPASAATWGGIGSVIGYSLGTAFPMIALIFLGKKIRTSFPKGNTLTEFIKKKLGKDLFKLILILMVFYMFVFLCAEVTAVAILIQYISGTPLWITALIIIVATLMYTLYGGLRASILTDNIQFLIIVVLLIVCLNYLLSNNLNGFSILLIKEKVPHLLSANYITNYTAGFTFFVAVAATNLFHQGNWQRVFAAKNNHVLKKSLIFSFLIIIPIVFMFGFVGLIAISQDIKVNPDLAFFSILLKDQSEFISIIVIVLAVSLTISTVDTLVNAISSLIIVDGKHVIKNNQKHDFIKLSKYIIIFLSLICFFVASKGYSILYLFLLADLFCCAAFMTVFYNFYNKNIKEKTSLISIILGLFFGLLLFPAPDFSKSILTGVLLPSNIFPSMITQSLLFWSFLLATFVPVLTWKLK